MIPAPYPLLSVTEVYCLVFVFVLPTVARDEPSHYETGNSNTRTEPTLNTKLRNPNTLMTPPASIVAAPMQHRRDSRGGGNGHSPPASSAQRVLGARIYRGFGV